MSDLLEHRHRRRAPVFALALAIAAIVLAAIATSSARAAGLTVTNLPIVPVEGQVFAGPVATVTDSEAGPYLASEFTATIQWGDGLTQSGIVTVSGAEITVSAEGHTYAEEGSQTLTVEVAAPGHGLSGSRATTIPVADAPLLTVLFSTPTAFTHAGPGTNATLSVFEAGIGGANNGAKAGEQSSGFRHINWDQIALDGSQPEAIAISPNHTVAIPVGSQQDHGVQLDSPIAVSGDGFASVNAGVAGLFGSLSAPNIVAPFNTNAFTLRIVAPTPPGATPIPAATSGFGVTFLNVVISETTSVEYFNGEMLLAKVFALPGGHNQPSFVGALFNTPAITSVVVNLGTARIFNFNGTTFSAGPLGDSPPNNLVAADDIVLAEPVPDRLTLSATAGVALSGVLADFQDSSPFANSHDSLASVDWGDGSSSQGLIEANGGGGFAVSGTHTYAQAGTMPVSVAVHDLGGAHRTLHATVVVSAPTVAPPPIAFATPPIVISTPPPHCTLTAGAGSAKLARAPLGARAALAHSKKGGHTHRSPSRLRAVASCDQNATVRLTATATLAASGKRGRTATAAAGSTRSVLQTLALGATSAGITANHPATLTITLSAATLAKLTTAARRHKRISVAFTLSASGAHGTSSASATVGSLKL